MTNKLSLIFLFFLSYLVGFAQSKNEAHPVYIANLLVNGVSVEDMCSTCRYYSIKESEFGSDAITFSDCKGNRITIRTTSVSGTTKDTQPVIELDIRESAKRIREILSHTGYSKSKLRVKNNNTDTYERGPRHVPSRTICQISSNGSRHLLTFLKSRP